MYGLLRSANRVVGSAVDVPSARRERVRQESGSLIPSRWRSTRRWLPGRRGVGSAPSYCVRAV